MYAWKVGSLAKDIVEDRVGEDDQWGYLFVWITVCCPLYMFVGTPYGVGSGYFLGPMGPIAFVIAGLGVLICLRANKKGDGRDLLLRFVCLGTPVGIRMLLFAVLPSLLIMHAVENQFGYSVDMYLPPVLQIVYLWRVHYWIRTVSLKSQAMSSSSPIGTIESLQDGDPGA